MDDSILLLEEARALGQRLNEAWDANRFNKAYAARLVAVAERAQKRQIRRAARCGDRKAQQWLALLERVVCQERVRAVGG